MASEVVKEAALLSFESTEWRRFDRCADHNNHIMILIAETLSVSIAANINYVNGNASSAARPRTRKDINTYIVYFLLQFTRQKYRAFFNVYFLYISLQYEEKVLIELWTPKVSHPNQGIQLHFSPLCVQELEAIKARVREMEEEAEKLKELQNEVEKQMNMSPPPGVPLSSISQLEFFRLTHRNIRALVCSWSCYYVL